MSSFRQQALIEASLERVWGLVGNPGSYPHWASGVVAVTGLAEVDVGARFQQVSQMPIGKAETTYEITDLDDLHEIRLRCTSSGLYSRWLLTPAQDSTFADVEFGIEPTALQYRVLFAALGDRYMRRIAFESLDGLQRTLTTPGRDIGA